MLALRETKMCIARLLLRFMMLALKEAAISKPCNGLLMAGCVRHGSPEVTNDVNVLDFFNMCLAFTLCCDCNRQSLLPQEHPAASPPSLAQSRPGQVPTLLPRFVLPFELLLEKCIGEVDSTLSDLTVIAKL